MTDKIIIDFNEEKNKDNEKIVVYIENDINEKEIKEKIAYSYPGEKINSYFYGNPALTKFFESEIEFPLGIEKGFKARIDLELTDSFLNSILENSLYIILASTSGKVYFIDRDSGKIKEIFTFENEPFEKTGIVINNDVYLISVRSIYKFTILKNGNEDKIIHEKIYNSNENYFIWSNLNLIGNELVFIEYDKRENAFIKTLNLHNSNVKEFPVTASKFISDQVCVFNDMAIFLSGGSINIFDGITLSGYYNSLNISPDARSIFLNERFYFTAKDNGLYYFDPDPETAMKDQFPEIKFTGIKENIINSMAGSDGFIFTGTLHGWNCYGINGMPVYSFEDSDENKIEALSKNLLVISKKNKLVFHNLNMFQEAESKVLTSIKNYDEIISALISRNEIFVLTSNGKLKSFTNDLLNIHV